MAKIDTYRGAPTRSVTYAAIADDDAIKTSVATNVAAQTYTGVALNGVVGAAAMSPTRTLNVTTTASGATYVLTPIVVTGTYGGAVVTQSLVLTQVGGNETISGTQPFDAVTSIAIPAQDGGGGTFKFGVFDVVAPSGQLFVQVRAGTAAAVKVQFQDGTSDTLDMAAKEREALFFERLLNTGTVSTGVTVYL